VIPKGGVDHALALGFKGGKNRNPVSEALRALGLWGTRSSERFVPEDYLWNTSEVRLGVLQGLLDSDGSVHVQEGRKGARSVLHLLFPSRPGRGLLGPLLGGVVYHRVRPQDRLRPGLARGRPVYHRAESHVLDIRLPPGLPPFRLARKAKVYAQTGGIRPMRFVEVIEPAGKQRRCASRWPVPTAFT
jgi:phosphate starvation-inducible PhoH-like protein